MTVFCDSDSDAGSIQTIVAMMRTSWAHAWHVICSSWVTPVLLIHKHQTPRTAWIIIFISILIPEVSGQCQCQVISKINTYLTFILSERHNDDIKRPSYPTHSCNVEMSAAAAASSSVITRCHQTPGSLASACHQDVISLVRCSAGPDPGWVLHSKVPTPIPASWVAWPESWISEASI